MAELVYKKLVKQYRPDLPPALDRLDLNIRDWEFIALLGPSGCGKSTTLRMTAGLESISDGQIVIGGKVVNNAHPKDRGIGLAFENYALYPPLTIRDNLAFNLRAHGVNKTEIDKRVAEISKYMHVEELLDLKQAALSSGQKQRVNIARALIRRPAVLLLDEPLSHLDAALRVKMRTEIKRLNIEQRFTTIIVTHDQLEAMALADRIAVLNDGKLQQFDTPLQVFNEHLRCGVRFQSPASPPRDRFRPADKRLRRAAARQPVLGATRCSAVGHPCEPDTVGRQRPGNGSGR